MKEILVVCALLIALTNCCVFGEHFIYYEDQDEKEYNLYITIPICKPLHTCDINPSTGEVTIERFESTEPKKHPKDDTCLSEFFACCALVVYWIFLYFIGALQPIHRFSLVNNVRGRIYDTFTRTPRDSTNVRTSSKTIEEQTPLNKETPTLGPEHETAE